MLGHYTETVCSVNGHHTVLDIYRGRSPGLYTGMSFATNLADMRRRRNWTQDQLAEAVGVSQVTVSRWETGEREPRGKLRAKLAKALEASEADLFRFSEGAEAEPRIISLPVQLPNADVLTDMFRTLLELKPEEPGMDARARMLARSFPSIFQAHLSLPSQTGGDDERSEKSRPHAGDENPSSLL